MLVLGIESSCDETGVALVQDGVLVDALLASQADVHALFGGVVPELASREHYRCINPLYDTLMQRNALSAMDLDAVAVSRGPGLLGSLLVGVAFAKGLCLGSKARLVGVNHLMAHLLSCGLTNPLTFPALGVLVSGGHTNLYLFEDAVHAVQLGRTLDDAAGEAFDKCAKNLGLAYPGGKLISELAARGKADAHLFPRPYLDNDNLDFSFSGLKTAVSLHAATLSKTCSWPRPLTKPEDAPQALCDCCASFNLAVVETLLAKTKRALNNYPQVQSILLAGGVAANPLLRVRMQELACSTKTSLCMPSPELCTDNGVMIAYAGWLYANYGLHHDLTLEAIPRGRPLPDDFCRNDC